MTTEEVIEELIEPRQRLRFELVSWAFNVIGFLLTYSIVFLGLAGVSFALSIFELGQYDRSFVDLLFAASIMTNFVYVYRKVYSQVSLALHKMVLSSALNMLKTSKGE